ncbi:hypothetical protein AB833_17235 [Chromatiales bacterium (ex Bugula neritina AB1)]|nr:hypothetical protein AB833_17235 [Chromatiales bacterium (ex Bugula neritina AB1)]
MLKVVPIFNELSDEALQELADKCRRLIFKRNTVMMPQGEPGECLYIIESGSAKVFVGDSNGRELVLYEEGPGSYIGDISLLDDEPRSASVVTLEKTQVLSVSKEDFLACLASNPSISLSIIRTLTRRLRDATEGIRSLALDNVYRRLADKLMEISVTDENGKISLPKRYSHQDLGNMIGASREMVGKVMAELLKGEYIEMRDKRLYILKSLPRNW